MAKHKLKWSNVEDIVFRLIDEFPSTDPNRLNASEIQKLVSKLPDFGDDPKKANAGLLETIQSKWFAERSEMVDELGPFESTGDDDEDELDEDEYRDDKMADDDSTDDDDDDDEDEFGDGFQEEGEDDER